MGFLTFLGIASAIAYGAKSETSASINKFRKEDFLKSVNYEIDVRRDFGEICFICGVQQLDQSRMLGLKVNNLPPVWPENGWKQCIPFLEEQPTITDADITDFIDCYHIVRQESLKALQNEYNKSYESEKKFFHKEKIPTDFTIYEKNHWFDIDVEEHQKRANDIYYNTFWSEIATGPAKIIDQGFGKRREIWRVRAYHKVFLNDFYSACRNKVGYNDYML